jgi:hypothetical protein
MLLSTESKAHGKPSLVTHADMCIRGGETAMSWLLIFSSTIVPILMLVVIGLVESLKEPRTKLCMVRVPVSGTAKCG